MSETLPGFPIQQGSGARALSGLLCTLGVVAAQCPQPPPTPDSQSPCLRAILRLPRPLSALPPAGPAWGGRCHPPSLPPFLSPPPGPDQLQLQAWPGQFQGVGRLEGSCLALEDKVTSSSVFIPLGHHGTCNSSDTDRKSEAVRREFTQGPAESQS